MSKPFHFRLERVQSLRERAEDQAREELAHGLARHRAGAVALAAAVDAEDAARATTRSTLLAGATGADLVAAHAFAERVEGRKRSAALDLQQREAEVAARRGQLVEAAREREVLDRLERQARSRHELEQARVEQIGLDEIALAVHRRGQAA